MRYLKCDMGHPFWPRIPSEFCFWKQNLHFQQHSSKALSQPEPRKGGPHVPRLCAHRESLSLCSPSWRRSMKRSSLKFYLDFWELEKLERNLFFLLLWMMMKPFQVIGFESFFSFPFHALTAIFKLGEYRCWKGCAHPDRLYGGASQGYSMFQRRDIKELWRLGKPRGCRRQCPRCPEVQTAFCIFLPGKESPRLLYHRKWQFWSEAGFIVQMRQVCDSLGERSVRIPLSLCAPVDLNWANVHRQDLYGVPNGFMDAQTIKARLLILCAFSRAQVTETHLVICVVLNMNQVFLQKKHLKDLGS